MIEVQFHAEDLKALNYERFNHPHPRVQRRMEALWLKGQGLPHEVIARATGVSNNTMRKYLIMYKEGGIDRLKEVNFRRPQSDLANHKETIESYFREHPVASIQDAIAKIEELTGIRRSPTQVQKFLKSIGAKWRKVGMIPSKADIDEQKAFKEEKLEPRLEEAKAGKRIVLFVDAAHFVWSAFLGYLWCFTRIFIKAPSGRKRFNVLGALNAITHELIMVSNDAYINSQSVCELLHSVAARYVGIPITLVLDNARYQKCALVKELAESLNIELLYLPPYSPNLNLIERMWKFVKKECLYSEYYDNFLAFKTAISNCLAETHTKHKKKLDSLLNLHFQTFEKGW